jgi:mannitol/fructose-specific phosphotransferase system IIA component (Ntr-type)
MKLANLLGLSHILPALQSTERSQAIEELLNHLMGIEALECDWRSEILDSLYNRENIISTGVGAGIAIPHAFSDHVKDVVAVFGRSEYGIDFKSSDGELVHFIILFISPRALYHKHLQALAAIARIFTQPNTRSHLLGAVTAEELHSLFRMKNVSLMSLTE